jgi:hypothetical protein
MATESKVTSNKELSKDEKSQVLDTAGGEMPDPNRISQTPKESDFDTMKK